MTDETIEPTDQQRKPRILLRFAVAFLIGLLATSAIGVGALYAYDQQYTGRILPGVSVGSLNLAGLARDEAIAEVERTYAYIGEGEVLLDTPVGEMRIPFSAIDRRVDAQALVDAALAVGRSGGPIERVIADARTALNGVALEPMITFDAEALAAEINRLSRRLTRTPVNAAVAKTADGFQLLHGQDGRAADPAAATEAALAILGELDAPAVIEVAVPTSPIAPDITNDEAMKAKLAADRIVTAVTLQRGDETWQISTKRLHGWISFAADGEGGYGPVVDTSTLPGVLRTLAKEIDQAPRNATFKTSGAKIVGVVPSREGRGVDVEATATKVEELLGQRAGGSTVTAIEPVMQVTEPALTTAEAEAAVPKMRKVSQWTTYFPISEKNGFGANIWIPALDLNGHVVAPGETFDFWEGIGPVTRERGYRDGGAIINGRTEPQGALAGGICSTSTTLFNAALRAGLEMGDRRNHYYYIDRYPLGLDATVFKSNSSVQTMSFTNDTKYPVLIRGYRIRDGGSGYVKFELWSVPTGRKVTFSKPLVKNIRPASDTVQMTSALRPGVRQRVEYPADGKQVWVTRTVRDSKGKVLHTDTYYSNYARITGITLVGKGAKPAPTPSPTPDPSP